MSARTRDPRRSVAKPEKVVSWDVFSSLAALTQESVMALGKANDLLTNRVASLEQIIVSAQRAAEERHAGTTGLVTITPEIIR